MLFLCAKCSLIQRVLGIPRMHLPVWETSRKKVTPNLSFEGWVELRERLNNGYFGLLSLSILRLSTVRAQVPIKNCFTYYSFVGLGHASSIGFQSRLFWVPISQVAILKSTSFASFLGEKLGIRCSLLTTQCYSRGKVYGVFSSFSYACWSGYLLICQTCRNHSSSFWNFFPRELLHG